MHKFKYIFLVFIGLNACSPKATLDETQLPPVPDIEIITESATGPCVSLKQLTPTDRDEAETNFALYRDFYKSKEYDKAVPLWERAFELAPSGNGTMNYHFDDGVGLYKAKFELADSSEKRQYIDRIMDIYDRRAECRNDEAYVTGRKAFDYYYHFRTYVSDDELFTLFEDALNAKGDKADYFIINPMTALLIEQVVNFDMPYEKASPLAKQMLSSAKYGLENCDKDCEAWQVVNDYAPARLESFEGLKGFYDCDYYREKYYPLFLDNPTDCEIINKAYSSLKWGACLENDSILAEIALAKQTNCYTPPPKESTLKQAYNAYTEGEYKEAVDLFQQFIDSTDDLEKKAKYNLLIAKIYYGDLKNFSKSRSKALEAAGQKSNWGEPYILIGKLYASSGPLCGPGTGFDSQIVTWPAIDKFEYAKRIDPSVADEANKWINRYRQYMPKKEDLFFRSLSVGNSYKVGCWINETTTIRTSD
jgi:hypothetical protein